MIFSADVTLRSLILVAWNTACMLSSVSTGTWVVLLQQMPPVYSNYELGKS